MAYEIDLNAGFEDDPDPSALDIIIATIYKDISENFSVPKYDRYIASELYMDFDGVYLNEIL